MASTRRALGVCDVCGFEYPYRSLIKNSYGLLVCPSDYEGKFDLKNNPQNKSSNSRDDEYIVDSRPHDELDIYVPVTASDWLPSQP
jgi:hypothetical protein